MNHPPHHDVAPADQSEAAGRCYRSDPARPERLLRIDKPEADPVDDASGANTHAAADLTAAAVHGAFRAFVLDPHYTCVGAKSAVNSGSYRLGVYGELGGADATRNLAADLFRFTQAADEIDAAFATFVAVFESPRETSEQAFERLLWGQLQHLHDVDVALHRAWDPTVSSDPANTHFSFSFGELAFFIVGLHPNAARMSRRFAWPTLVFNPHQQFERLRAEGKWGRMQEVIREKEVQLQGNINPVLRDFGDESEAKQYSGRAVDKDWQPPFHPTPEDNKNGNASKCPFHRVLRALGRSK
ncbi:MAG: guanitoxin biosynthesis heme-dependent pre-guanitoxin N-hydroxylase GntA [Phycisphaerae bacterium]